MLNKHVNVCLSFGLQGKKAVSCVVKKFSIFGWKVLFGTNAAGGGGRKGSAREEQ